MVQLTVQQPNSQIVAMAQASLNLTCPACSATHRYTLSETAVIPSSTPREDCGDHGYVDLSIICHECGEVVDVRLVEW